MLDNQRILHVGPPSLGTEGAVPNVQMRISLFGIKLVKTSDKTGYQVKHVMGQYEMFI